MRKSVILVLHLSFWVLIGLFFYPILRPILTFNEITHVESIRNIKSAIPIVAAAIISVFYTAYFATPFFIKNKKRLFILIASILILAVAYTLKSRYINNNSAYILNTVAAFTPYLILGFIASIFRAVIELWKDRLVKTKLEKDQLFTQLELLKAKIDPHFLFNSLNNIDVLIEEDPKRGSEYLTKLSDILRYVLYEAKDEEILLAKELDQIKSYVELQRIRTHNTSFATLKIRGEVNRQKIAPMVFIPFIENAFKHCKNKSIENAIRIEFDIYNEYITMNCKNYYSTTHPVIAENEGIGTGVVKQRLNLLYPKSHELVINKSDSWFTVTLTIKLKNED